MKSYRINEMFYSLQGEGRRAGAPSIFCRFTGCNLRCAVATHGFDCDTEWTSGSDMTAADIIAEALRIGGACRVMILTGGEPLLQVDADLVDALLAAGFFLCVETNGTKPIPPGIGWVSMSPKVAEHAVVPDRVDELRYVRRVGQGIPKPRASATHLFISPAADAEGISSVNLDYCIQLVQENPQWSLSVQQHKLWRVR